MNRLLLCLLTAVVATATLQYALAQTARKKEAAKPADKEKREVPPVMVDVMLGRYGATHGMISKRLFDSFAKQGLRLASSAPAGADIDGFAFTYAERSMYEDSVGNPLAVTEYLIEYCDGDTLTSAIRGSLFDRTKAGDTVYFDQIRINLPSHRPARGKALKFVIGQ